MSISSRQDGATPGLPAIEFARDASEHFKAEIEGIDAECRKALATTYADMLSPAELRRQAEQNAKLGCRALAMDCYERADTIELDPRIEVAADWKGATEDGSLKFFLGHYIKLVREAAYRARRIEDEAAEEFAERQARRIA